MAISQRTFRILQQKSGPILKGLFESKLLNSVVPERLIVALYDVYKGLEAVPMEEISRFVLHGTVAFDVGAHFGYYTTRFSSMVGERGKVIAIEPNDYSRQILERNLARRRICNVRVFPCAAWSVSTELELKIDGPLGVTSNIKRHAQSGGSMVQCRTIDEIVVELGNVRVGFIKVDVEGSEVDVLLGAKQTLIDHRPVVLCEIGSDYGIDGASHLIELFEILATTSYECCDVSNLSPFTQDQLYDSLSSLRYLDVILRPYTQIAG